MLESVIVDLGPTSRLSADELYTIIDDLLMSLAREHEDCCTRDAYALELASADLSCGQWRHLTVSLPTPRVLGVTRQGLALRLLESMIPFAVDVNEEDAITSAHHWTCLAHLCTG